MNNQYRILFLFFLIKGNDARNCTKLDTTVKHCPSSTDWFHQTIIHNCIFIRKTKSSWPDARNYCKKNFNGDLASAVTYKESEQVCFYLDIAKGTRSWVGMSNIDPKQGYFFTNGIKPKAMYGYWNWLWLNPYSDIKEKCIFMTSLKNLLGATKCTDKRFSLCQTESYIGPRELKMEEVNWHNSAQKLIYVGFKLSVTCSVFSPFNGTIHWSIENGNGTRVTTLNVSKIESHITTRHNLEINQHGKCGNKTYTTFTVIAKASYDDFHLSCYPRPRATNEVCSSQHKLAYCKRVKIQISDAVKSKVTLRISYRGAPGPAMFNTTITVSCTVRTNGRQQSIILINQATGPVKPESVTIYPTRSSDTLTFHVSFTKQYANVSFSCFAYDVLAEKTDTKCRRDNQFCEEFGPIPSPWTKGAENMGPRSTYIILRPHVRPNYFYNGTYMYVSCSALSAFNGSLRWKIFRPFKKFVENISSDIIYSSDTTHKITKKGNKTQSKLSIFVSSQINKTKLSCYSDSYPHNKSCEHKRSMFKYCDATDLYIIVVKKPARPKLVIDYPGFPEAVQAGSAVTASCTAASWSAVHTISWIIFKYGRYGTMVVERDASILKSYEEYINITARKTEPKYYITSTLKIPIKASMDGMSIGCSAYEIYLDNLKGVCTSRDGLCQRSKPIKVIDSLVKMLLRFTIAIALLMVIALVARKLYIRLRSSQNAEDDDGEEASPSASDTNTRRTSIASSFHRRATIVSTNIESDMSSKTGASTKTKKTSVSTTSSKTNKTSKSGGLSVASKQVQSMVSSTHNESEAHQQSAMSDRSSTAI